MSVFGLHGAAWLAPLTALLVSIGGRLMARRWRWGLPAVCAGASLAGWVILAPGGWRELVWPRGALDHLVIPALALAVAGLLQARLRTRWLGVAVVLFAAWWMAGVEVARPEFWRVWFAGLLVAWTLTRAGAGEASRGLSVALAMLGGMVLAGAGSLWIEAALVLAAASLGMMASGAGKVVPRCC